MKRTMTLTSVLAVLAVSMLATDVAAQEAAPSQKTAPAVFTCPMHPQIKLAQAGKCPICGMALVKKAQVASPPAAGCCPSGRMGGSSKTAQAPPPEAGQSMMRRCRVMMNTPIFLDGPSAIRGQAQDLGLSEEQQKKLLGIETEARKKALAVLTPEQRKKMGDIPGKPTAMAQMCAKMKPMMQKKTGDKGMDKPMMMCPMMKMMRGRTAPAASGTNPQGSGTKPERSGAKSDR